MIDSSQVFVITCFLEVLSKDKSNDEEEYTLTVLYREHSGVSQLAVVSCENVKAERNEVKSVEHGLRAAHRAAKVRIVD